MPRKRRRAKERRPSANSEDVCWLLDEPFHYECDLHALMSKVSALEDAVTRGIQRGFYAKSFDRSPLTPEDVKFLPHWHECLKTLRRLRKVYDDLPEGLKEDVPEDRRALVMAVDDNVGDPDLWWERKRAEQDEIDKRTGRKAGELFSARDGKPYNLQDLYKRGELRGAARRYGAETGELRKAFEATPLHVRIQVLEAWAILDAKSSDDTWDRLLEHYEDLDLE